MNRFLYRATDENGRTIDGELHAHDFAEALGMLQQQRLSIQQISQAADVHDQDSADRPEGYGESASVPASRDQALVNIRAWAEPLSSLAGEKEFKPISRSLTEVSEKLRLAEDVAAVAADPKTANLLPVFLQKWESSGTNFNWLQDFNNHSWGRSSDRYALRYAILCLTAAFGLLGAFAIWIAPVFEQMFAEFGLMLPAPTRLVFWVSSQINDSLARTLLVVAIFAGALLLVRVASQRLFFVKKYLLKVIPESRKRVGALAVLSQNTAELSALGYGIAAAVELAAKGCRDPFYRRLSHELADEMSKGINPVYSSSAGWLPALLRGLLNLDIAIDTAKLRQLGLLYRHRLRRYNLSGSYVLLSQVVLMIAGGLLGFAVISLFLPLISLITGLAT